MPNLRESTDYDKWYNSGKLKVDYDNPNDPYDTGMTMTDTRVQDQQPLLEGYQSEPYQSGPPSDEPTTYITNVPGDEDIAKQPEGTNIMDISEPPPKPPPWVGMKEDLSDPEVQEGFRKSVIKTHPDLNGDDPDIRDIFELSGGEDLYLKDRKKFDANLKREQSRQLRDKAIVNSQMVVIKGYAAKQKELRKNEAKAEVEKQKRVVKARDEILKLHGIRTDAIKQKGELLNKLTELKSMGSYDVTESENIKELATAITARIREADSQIADLSKIAGPVSPPKPVKEVRVEPLKKYKSLEDFRSAINRGEVPMTPESEREFLRLKALGKSIKKETPKKSVKTEAPKPDKAKKISGRVIIYDNKASKQIGSAKKVEVIGKTKNGFNIGDGGSKGTLIFWNGKWKVPSELEWDMIVESGLGNKIGPKPPEK